MIRLQLIFSWVQRQNEGQEDETGCVRRGVSGGLAWKENIKKAAAEFAMQNISPLCEGLKICCSMAGKATARVVHAHT